MKKIIIIFCFLCCFFSCQRDYELFECDVYFSEFTHENFIAVTLFSWNEPNPTMLSYEYINAVQGQHQNVHLAVLANHGDNVQFKVQQDWNMHNQNINKFKYVLKKNGTVYKWGWVADSSSFIVDF